MKFFNWFIRVLVWLSVINYMVEASTGSAHSYDSLPIFLWFERFVACVLTFEYFFRWRREGKDYPTSALGIIDAIAIVPFWLGFIVPVSWLDLIRSMRILRLLKEFRYSRSLQLIALGFYRAKNHLKSLGFAMFIVGMFATVAVFEVEQPHKTFDHMGEAAWFVLVTVTTVGYGDITPVSDMGRIVTVLTMFTGLLVYAGIVGVVGNSFAEVLAEEKDPNIDPIEQFRRAQEQHRLHAEADRKFRERQNA